MRLRWHGNSVPFIRCSHKACKLVSTEMTCTLFDPGLICCHNIVVPDGWLGYIKIIKFIYLFLNLKACT